MRRTGNGRKAAVIVLVCSLLFAMAGCEKEKKDKMSDPNAVRTQVTTGDSATTQTQISEKHAQEKETGQEYILSVAVQNQWQDKNHNCTQLEAKIVNAAGQEGTDWQVTMEVPKGATMQNGWNGSYKIKGKQLIVTPAEYNRQIGNGEEVTFGFILNTRKTFTLQKAQLHIGKQTYAMTEKATENEQEEPVTQRSSDSKKSQKKETKTPLANHGALAVKGTDIVDKNGENYRLQGISTHGLACFPQYVNKEAFASLSTYGVNAIQLAMYTEESGGYCNGGDQKQLESWIAKGVDACTELGMYVVIDWHVLSEGDPNKHVGEARKFFQKMAETYKDHTNVIYEICNEPCNGTTWEQIRSYAEEVIPVIRRKDKKALIIVGTPNWSQEVDVAAEKPIRGYHNLLYAAHFYAATHKEELREKVVHARQKGLPVIISECNICEASGNGRIDYDEAEKWMTMIRKNQMSVFAWNLSNKDEKSALLKASVTKTAGFNENDFSQTGKWFLKQYKR